MDDERSSYLVSSESEPNIEEVADRSNRLS
jgi:hypothetical protein